MVVQLARPTHELETANEGRGDEDIGKGEAVANEEGLGGEDLLEVISLGKEGGLGRVDLALVVGDGADEGAEPGGEAGEEGAVGPVHPLLDGGGILLGGSEETSLVLASEVLSWRAKGEMSARPWQVWRDSAAAPK